MKALLFERSVPKFAAARLGGQRFAPLRLAEVDEPALPGPGWRRVRPRLAGICGSDVATMAGRSSRWFEPIVSFPFTPGHEVVGELEDGTRVVIEPVLTCAPRGRPLCDGCRHGWRNRCESIAAGHIEPGLQIGYCADTGGGWGLTLVAHETQLHAVPTDLSDEAAVMVEPAACAVHAARQTRRARPAGGDDPVVVIGAGTLGLCTIAALSAIVHPEELIAVAKHPEQRKMAGELGATTVCQPGELTRAVRRATGSLMIGTRVAGGAGLVIDCVGTADSLEQALDVIRPGGTVGLVGMPGRADVDLTPLWQREVSLTGCYAYSADDFDEAFRLVRDANLGQLVSALYPLDRFRDAIQHATDAGRRGAVKIAFDLRQEKHR